MLKTNSDVDSWPFHPAKKASGARTVLNCAAAPMVAATLRRPASGQKRITTTLFACKVPR
jgi:hypothetical protein